MRFESWGRFPAVKHRGAFSPATPADIPAIFARCTKSLLPRGNGRSYGDSCLNADGYLLLSRRLDHFIRFDPQTGRLCCEPGVTFDDLLRICVPAGWFPPVTPGTKYVTIGGAIANDVHGKNHHRVGSFGRFIEKLTLFRSNGEIIECSPEHNPDWFQATVGGLGLTGFILQAEIRLKKIPGPYIEVEIERFADLIEFLRLTRAARDEWEYTVGWLDAANLGRAMGRGILLKGRHTNQGPPVDGERRLRFALPVDFPSAFPLLHFVKAYNRYYFNKPKRRSVQYFETFFYPLDAVLNWNRIYGKRGLLQWQGLIPEPVFPEIAGQLLLLIRECNLPSYLAVVKDFGQIGKVGMLSFPGPGITVAFDFPNTGPGLWRMLDRFDEMVIEAGGRIYPAKDARMQGSSFRRAYPEYEAFQRFIDKNISSSFWRRVMS